MYDADDLIMQSCKGVNNYFFENDKPSHLRVELPISQYEPLSPACIQWLGRPILGRNSAQRLFVFVVKP